MRVADIPSPFGTTGGARMTWTVRFGVRLPSVTLCCGSLRHRSVWSLLYRNAWRWSYQDKATLPGGAVETNSRRPSLL